ncbi:MAG: hypothetical protein V2B14_01665 [bacterium]
MIDKEKDYILQVNLKNYFENEMGKETWLTVYEDKKGEDFGIYCCLIPNERINISLSYAEWVTEFGNDEDIELLVICRNWHGVKESYNEISEEFRFFHNLYFDGKNNKYIKIDEDGNEDDAIIFENDCIKIKLLYIRQFLAIKENVLLIQIDSVYSSKYSLEELSLNKKNEDYKTNDDIYYYTFWLKELSLGEDKTVSRLLGKKVIYPLPKEKSGIYPYNKKERKYLDFIIGIDESGQEITYNCNPDNLANNFGANKGAPNYLTPVFFKKEVLTKYYSYPEKYTVKDSNIRCGGLWDLRIDNNHLEYVNVYLGDLGKYISSNEQLYWKSFNIASDSNISNTRFKRDVSAEWVDPERADLCFKSILNVFQEKWEKKYEWNFFKPLTEEDAYRYSSLRIPLNNSQLEFDGQIGNLAIIIIDSLNIKEINKYINPSKEDKGIDRLEQFFVKKDFKGYKEHIDFLRNLQSLRSTGVAHRKGENYEKIVKIFKIDENDLQKVFEDILIKAISFIKYLEVNLIYTEKVITENIEAI